MRLRKRPRAVGAGDGGQLGAGGAERLREVGVGIRHQLGQQLVAGREVAVERRPGHPEPLRDRVHGDPLRACVGELDQGGHLDLVAHLGAVAVSA